MNLSHVCGTQSDNYDIFIGLIRVVSRRHIPRGCRTNYIPGLTVSFYTPCTNHHLNHSYSLHWDTEVSQSLYEAYKKQYSSNPFAEGTLETGNKLIDTMKEEKKKRWGVQKTHTKGCRTNYIPGLTEEVITSIDRTHNSRKTWQTIKKLSNDPTSPNPPCLVNSNQVAHHLIVNGQGTMPTKPKCPALPTVEGKPSLVSAFSEEEYRKGITALKNNKAAGMDDILVEQLKNLGPKAHKWLHTMLNTCFIVNKITKIWKACTSQLLNLTQHIEDGYQRGMITGAAFVDLSAAYNTMNHRILIQKLYNTTHDSQLCRVFQNMLYNRRFYEELNNERSRWRKQKHGLPHGSVLSPILFNIYTYDQPIHDRKRNFIYANDLCVTAQYSSFTEVNTTIGDALEELTQYYRSNKPR